MCLLFPGILNKSKIIGVVLNTFNIGLFTDQNMRI